ncbi:hypothetical protein Acr_18g0007880 [Actinidia rufa]|uniref:Uncharacterized protein n=1 Tax=Actinidia rufa TaxID=165716 RepID=A0A7J0G759_9ERIC|nr:hypothetical protein Acr_18g0007880 [Actinidia rufa]
MAIKAQALADFISKFTYDATSYPEVEGPKEQDQGDGLARWKLFEDGLSNQHGCGAGLVLQNPSGEQMEYAISIGFKATNNEAKYKAPSPD